MAFPRNPALPCFQQGRALHFVCNNPTALFAKESANGTARTGWPHSLGWQNATKQKGREAWAPVGTSEPEGDVRQGRLEGMTSARVALWSKTGLQDFHGRERPKENTATARAMTAHWSERESPPRHEAMHSAMTHSL